MAKSKEPRAHDAEAEAATQIYQVAKAEAEKDLSAMREEMDSVRQESFAMGAIKAIDATIAYNEFLKIMTLYRIKQNKDYKAGGMNWEQFCDAVGVPRRSIETILTDMKPLFEEFTAKSAAFCGMPINKVRYLGRAIAADSAGFENDCLVFNGESIPLTPENKEEIEAILDSLQEEIRNRKEELDATVSAKDKVLRSKEDVINKQERELKKFERDAAKKGLTVTEDAFIQRMDNLRTTFDGLMLQIEPAYMADLAPAEGGTQRMAASYLTTLDYARKQLMVAYQQAEEMYGDATMCPEDAWTPPVKG